MTDTGSYIILNVDDDEAGRYAKTRILQGAGYRVLEAGSGHEALTVLSKEAPPLVLLDVQLPDMSGHEVCRIIKTDPGLAHTLVLQMSAFYVQGADRVRGLDQGADAYLIEPIEADELVAVIRALLRLHRREEDNRRLLRQQHLLYKLADAVNRAEGLADLYEQALDTILKSLNADRASILLFDDEGVMRFKAWRGLSEQYRRAVEGHSPWKREAPGPRPICGEQYRGGRNRRGTAEHHPAGRHPGARLYSAGLWGQSAWQVHGLFCRAACDERPRTRLRPGDRRHAGPGY